MKRFVRPELKSFLLSPPPAGDTKRFTVADCLTLALAAGQVFRITSFDRNITIATDATVNQPGGTFDSMGTRMRRSMIENKRGMQTSQVVFVLVPDVTPDLSGGVVSAPPVQAQGMSLVQASVAGLLYGAAARFETVYGDPVGGGGLARQSDGTYTDGGWGSLIKFI